MSLAMYAAPFDNETYQINNDNKDLIARKKNARAYTQKRIQAPVSAKVNTILQSLENLPDDSDAIGLADFLPLPPPQSAGVMKTDAAQQGPPGPPGSQGPQGPPGKQGDRGLYHYPVAPQQKEHFTNQEASSQEDYYSRFIPNYNQLYKTSPTNIPHYPTSNQAVANESNSLLLEKLNYMIHLLEEQQDERTNNVTEEVVLYCFLGVFVIFVVDSFVRVGKYVR